MDERQFVDYLLHFGLTRQEAGVYERLLLKGKQTGYEAAKEAGISRSNAYSALAALTDKGAAYVMEDSARRYVPVPLKEFLENCLRRMEREKDWLIENLPEVKAQEEGYITIEGEANVCDKIINLMEETKERVYLSCSAPCLESFSGNLIPLTEKKRRVVVITDAPVALQGAEIYVAKPKGSQIGLITDSKHVLSGEYGPGSRNTCLYSGNENFVQLFKNALANEIELITIHGGKLR